MYLASDQHVPDRDVSLGVAAEEDSILKRAGGSGQVGGSYEGAPAITWIGGVWASADPC